MISHDMGRFAAVCLFDIFFFLFFLHFNFNCTVTFQICRLCVKEVVKLFLVSRRVIRVENGETNKGNSRTVEDTMSNIVVSAGGKDILFLLSFGLFRCSIALLFYFLIIAF